MPYTTVNPVLWYYTLQYSLNHRDEKDGERCLLRTKCETGAREAPPDVGLHLVFRRPRVSGCRLCERFALPRYEARMANRGRDLGRDAKGTLCGGDDEAEEDDTSKQTVRFKRALLQVSALHGAEYCAASIPDSIFFLAGDLPLARGARWSRARPH